MNSKGGPPFGGCMLMNSRGEPPLWLMNSKGGPPFLGGMLMNSRGGPPILKGGLPLGTISMDHTVDEISHKLTLDCISVYLGVVHKRHLQDKVGIWHWKCERYADFSTNVKRGKIGGQ